MHNARTSEASSGLKACPFCAELIQVAAIKCRYCGEFLVDQPPPAPRLQPPPPTIPRHFSTLVIVLMLAAVGPLALPLVWLHPRWSVGTKTLITVFVAILTGVLIWLLFYVSSIYREAMRLAFPHLT